MNTLIIIFCILAGVFAVGTLFYVGGSAVKQVTERKQAEEKKPVSEESLPAGFGGWLLLGSLVGTASGILAAYVIANPKERKKKEAKKKT